MRRLCSFSRLTFFIVLMTAALLRPLNPAFGQTTTTTTAAVTVGVTWSGSLPRDTTQRSFNLNLILDNMPASEVAQSGATPQLMTDILVNRVKISIQGVDSNQALPYDNSATNAQRTLYATFLNGNQLPLQNGNSKLTISVRFTLNGTNTLATIAPNSTLSIQGTYTTTGGQTGGTSPFTTISKDDAVPVDPPAGFSILSGNKKISVNFAEPATINYTGSGGARTTPPMYVFMINNPTLPVTFAAKTFSPSQPTDPDTTCTYNPAIAKTSGNCMTCGASGSTDQIYLSSTQDTSRVSVITASSGQAFSGLDINQQYAFFLQYSPNGVTRSNCLIGKPTINYTLTELNGEGEAQSVDMRCVVATAAYGSPMHKHLRVLRWFRDKLLLRLPWGKRLVEAYYRQGEPVARQIAAHPTFAAAVRAALWLPILTLYTLQAAVNLPPHLAFLWHIVAVFAILALFASRFIAKAPLEVVKKRKTKNL